VLDRFLVLAHQIDDDGLGFLKVDHDQKFLGGSKRRMPELTEPGTFEK
jgi:hypothetical protein